MDGIEPSPGRMLMDPSRALRALPLHAVQVRSTLEYGIAVASIVFPIVFLIVSLVALRRARDQDVPETVRALAELLHPRATRANRDAPSVSSRADGGDDASRT